MQQNGGELTDSIKEESDLGERVTQQDFIDEEDLKICILGILKIQMFSSMLPSMLKGEIVSMNIDDITMGEY